ncbi:TPA: hypothetical protein IAD41_08570 [Candidatus Scatenecus faecavium]|uniref:Polysaccharide chain length determinant N-terminal domain-containing protein n=1 Tax=Candidatus Scatenecus faecavium TaxID=2840915 RepID=A0A9D1FX89_9BACT|nr:hypothetical protein [Candidatus Scatenecus faecavium]
MQQTVYIPQEDIDDELVIDLKKIFFAIWDRKFLISKTFAVVLLVFIALTFVTPKKYKVDTDLYINKANNSNMMEINPYAIEELGAAGGGMAALMSGGGALTNELELMQSPLVIDKVIRENNLIIKKKWGIIPNKKEGEYISTASFLKKNVSFENKKGTNVISIEYKNKDPELAYNVVNSIITNYIALHKELNSEKSKSDKKVIETEYNKAKTALNKKVNTVSGLPEQAIVSTGNLSAMSAFSKPAQQAMSTIQGQIIAGEKSRIAVTEEAAKVANLSSKLQWAKMVEEMSDSSKVLVIKEPQKLRDFEYSSPKLLVNILLGIVFGFIASIFAVVFAETTDKKLSYSMLGDNIIYDLENDFSDLKLMLLANQDKKIAIIVFENICENMVAQLKEFRNLTLVKADISSEFVQNIKNNNEVILFTSVGKTNSKLYKQIKTMLSEMNKKIALDVLIK